MNPDDNTQSAAPTPAPGAPATPDSAPQTPSAKPGTPTPNPIAQISDLLAGLVGKLVGLATRSLSPKLIGGVLSCSRDIGQIAVLAGIVLTLVYAIVAAIRYESFAFFAMGVGLAIGLVVAQYAATRFLASSDKIISNTPNRISSKAFLDCAGLLLLLAALGIFIGGIYVSIDTRLAAPLISAIVIAPLLTLAAAIALNPGVIGLEIQETSAGEEAIGIISFCLKIWLKIVPPLFCLLAIAGCIITIWSYFNPRMGSFSLSGATGAAFLPFVDTFMISGMAGPSLVLYACMTPVIVYLLFILFCLGLDIARAILVIPTKLDALKNKGLKG